MSDKDGPRLIQFPGGSSNTEIPKEHIEILEMALNKAKEGKIKSIILNFSYETETDDGVEEGLGLWEENGNLVELLGTIELLKIHMVNYIHDVSHDESQH